MLYILLGIYSLSFAFGMGYYNDTPPALDPVAIPDISIPQPPMDCVPAEERIQRNIHYCPDVSFLSRQNTMWHGPTGWKGNQISFTSTLTRFVGAQWTGTNVGRLVCLYTGDNINDFPVQIALSALVITPDLPVWMHSNKEKSTINCVSTNNQVCDCPIQLFQEQQLPLNAKEAVLEITSFN